MSLPAKFLEPLSVYVFMNKENHYEQFADVPVGERSDDESLCAPEELVLVLKVYVCDRDDGFICVLVEIKPRLLQPLKITSRLDVHSALEEQKHNDEGMWLSDNFRRVTGHLHYFCDLCRYSKWTLNWILWIHLEMMSLSLSRLLKKTGLLFA